MVWALELSYFPNFVSLIQENMHRLTKCNSAQLITRFIVCFDLWWTVYSPLLSKLHFLFLSRISVSLQHDFTLNGFSLFKRCVFPLWRRSSVGSVVVRGAQCDVFVTESGDVDRLWQRDRTHCVCTNTSCVGRGPLILHPFLPSSSLLFNNPGSLNRWKRVSEPAASAQTGPQLYDNQAQPWKWQRSFFPPPPPDKELFGHLLRAQRRLAQRWGRGGSRGDGLTEANSDWGSHSLRKGGEHFLAFRWFSEGKSKSWEHVVNLRKEGLCRTTWGEFILRMCKK